MAGRIKVRGDLVLAQKLEEVFEKADGKTVGISLCFKI
jgi:putative sterol carrier protein